MNPIFSLGSLTYDSMRDDEMTLNGNPAVSRPCQVLDVILGQPNRYAVWTNFHLLRSIKKKKKNLKRKEEEVFFFFDISETRAP